MKTENKLELLLNMLEEKDERIQQDFRLAMECPHCFDEERNADYYNGYDDGLCYAIEAIRKIMRK